MYFMDEKEYTPRQYKKETGHKAIPPAKEKKSVWMAVAIIVVIALLAIAIAFIALPNGAKNGNIENVTISIKENDTVYFCDETCKMQNAINQSNIEECSKLNDTNKEICYDALSGKILEACALVSDYEVKKSCTYKFAKESASIEPCYNLENGDRRECILSVDPCFYGEAEEKNKCLDIDKKDYRYCEGNEGCIYAYIEKYKTAEACDELSTAIESAACKSITKDIDVCKELPQTPQKDLCYQLYATKTNTERICRQISDSGTVYAHDCYLYFAITENDSSKCINVGIQENRKWDCYTQYSVTTGDLSGCNAIDSYASVAKNSCYFDVAKELMNPTLCENLATSAHKTQCYVATIIQQNVPIVSYCDGVSVDSWRNQCYTSIARREMDAKVCQKIQTTSEKDMCLYYVDQAIKGESNVQ
jgi:hypothetical protein